MASNFALVVLLWFAPSGGPINHLPPLRIPGPQGLEFNEEEHRHRGHRGGEVLDALGGEERGKEPPGDRQRHSTNADPTGGAGDQLRHAAEWQR